MGRGCESQVVCMDAWKMGLRESGGLLADCTRGQSPRPQVDQHLPWSLPAEPARDPCCPLLQQQQGWEELWIGVILQSRL